LKEGSKQARKGYSHIHSCILILGYLLWVDSSREGRDIRKKGKKEGVEERKIHIYSPSTHLNPINI
jgi:hypothetical protein